MVIWYIFPRFGLLYQEKSGNPGRKTRFDAFDEIELKFKLAVKDTHSPLLMSCQL
jgi:hypothetical protein